MNGKNWCGEEIRETAHEGVTQLSKMHTIPHFFCEYISRICLAGNMNNLQRLVLNPLTNRIFSQLDMASSLQGHTMWPFDAGIIVIEEHSGSISITDKEAGIRDATTQISEIDNLFWRGARGTNLGFTGVKRRTLLVLPEPSNGTAIAEHNTTTHAAEFKKRHKGALHHHINECLAIGYRQIASIHLAIACRQIASVYLAIKHKQIAIAYLAIHNQQITLAYLATKERQIAESI